MTTVEIRPCRYVRSSDNVSLVIVSLLADHIFFHDWPTGTRLLDVIVV